MSLFLCCNLYVAIYLKMSLSRTKCRRFGICWVFLEPIFVEATNVNKRPKMRHLATMCIVSSENYTAPTYFFGKPVSVYVDDS